MPIPLIVWAVGAVAAGGLAYAGGKAQEKSANRAQTLNNRRAGLLLRAKEATSAINEQISFAKTEQAELFKIDIAPVQSFLSSVKYDEDSSGFKSVILDGEDFEESISFDGIDLSSFTAVSPQRNAVATRATYGAVRAFGGGNPAIALAGMVALGAYSLLNSKEDEARAAKYDAELDAFEGQIRRFETTFRESAEKSLRLYAHKCTRARELLQTYSSNLSPLNKKFDQLSPDEMKKVKSLVAASKIYDRCVSASFEEL